MDKGIDKPQIVQAISDLDSTDKNVRHKALNFLLPRVETEITDSQDLNRINNKLLELASSSDVEIRRQTGNMCKNIISNTNPEWALTLAIFDDYK